MTQVDEGHRTAERLKSQLHIGDDHASNKSRRAAFWLRWLPLALLVALMVFGFAQGWQRFLTLDFLVSQRAALQDFLQAHYGQSLLLYMAAYVAVVALSLPGAAVLTLVSGLLFGWLIGGILSVFSATFGATLVFLIARSSLGSALSAKAGPLLGKIADGFQQDAFHYLLFLRLVPLFPFWLINLAPAVLGVSLRHFFFGTLLGILPGTFAFAFLGSGLDSVIEAQSAASGCVAGEPDCHVNLSLSSLVTPQLLIAFGVLGLVALIPPLIKWKRRHKPA